MTAMIDSHMKWSSSSRLMLLKSVESSLCGHKVIMRSCGKQRRTECSTPIASVGSAAESENDWWQQYPLYDSPQQLSCILLRNQSLMASEIFIALFLVSGIRLRLEAVG